MAEYGKYFSNLKRNAAISLALKVGQTVRSKKYLNRQKTLKSDGLFEWTLSPKIVPNVLLQFNNQRPYFLMNILFVSYL